MAEEQISILISAVDNASSTLNGIQNTLTQTNNNIQKNTEQVSNSFKEQTGNLLVLGNAAGSVDSIMSTYNNTQLRVENATDRVTNAQMTLSDAQDKLQKLQQSGVATYDQIAKAQDAVTKASNSLEVSENRLKMTEDAQIGAYISMGVQIINLIASFPNLLSVIESMIGKITLLTTSTIAETAATLSAGQAATINASETAIQQVATQAETVALTQEAVAATAVNVATGGLSIGIGVLITALGLGAGALAGVYMNSQNAKTGIDNVNTSLSNSTGIGDTFVSSQIGIQNSLDTTKNKADDASNALNRLLQLEGFKPQTINMMALETIPGTQASALTNTNLGNLPSDVSSVLKDQMNQYTQNIQTQNQLNNNQMFLNSQGNPLNAVQGLSLSQQAAIHGESNAIFDYAGLMSSRTQIAGLSNIQGNPQTGITFYFYGNQYGIDGNQIGQTLGNMVNTQLSVSNSLG